MQDKDNKRTKYRFLNVLHKIFLSKMYMSYFHFNLKIDVNGSLTTNASYEDRRGDPSTIMTMFCPVAELARFTRPVEDGIFITGYRISISNDGRNFGEEEDVFIFNSTFQNFEVIDEELKFTLKVLRFCCLFFSNMALYDEYRCIKDKHEIFSAVFRNLFQYDLFLLNN